MSDPYRSGWPDQPQGTGGFPANTDPAYSDPAYSGYWGPTQYGTPGAGYGVPPTQPTEQLPGYWQPGTGYPGAPPPPPEPPKKPSRWLWAAAAAAILLVTGLVLALVIVSNSSRDSTIVTPPSSSRVTLPPPLSPTLAPSTPIPPPTRTAIPAPLPIPTQTFEPTEPGLPQTPAPTGATETVVYTVNGQGRAINITYVDTGGIMQTEFNVALPWSKEVTLAAPAKIAASVAVVNIGRDVTCGVSVNGTLVRQRSGRGLTICTGKA